MNTYRTRKSSWFRGTAVIGVGLTILAGARPAFSVGNQRAETGPGPLSAANVSTHPSSLSSEPGNRSDLVRVRVSPTNLQLVGSDQGPIATDDPWVLFDGDGDTKFGATGRARVRITLSDSMPILGVGVYGQAGGSIAVFAEEGTKLTPISGLDVSLRDLPLRWSRFSTNAPIAARSMVLEWRPEQPGAGIRELEVWALGRPAPVPSTDGLADRLLVGVPPNAVEALAQPEAISISTPLVGIGGAATFQANLDRDARAFSRAFLIYELEGLPHWSAVVRRINGNSPLGGFGTRRGSRGGLQVEEINPAWLQSGVNEIKFMPSDENDPVGYRVRRLRIVGILGGSVDDPTVASSKPSANEVALSDGDTTTGIGTKSMGARGVLLDVPFATRSQLDSIAIQVAEKASGQLVIEPIRDGKIAGKAKALLNLDKLSPGWISAPIGGQDGALTVDGARISIRGQKEGSGFISEVRVAASPVPTSGGVRLAVTYPRHGECVDGRAYIRGFLTSPWSSTGTASLVVDGKATVLARDGGFGTSVESGKRGHDGSPWTIALSAISASGDEVRRQINIGPCESQVADSRPGAPVPDDGAPFGQVVKAGNAAALAFAGATLEIPAGAVAEDTRITVRPLDDLAIPAMDETLTNVTSGGHAYRLGPHGLRFQKPITLTIPYDRARFPGGLAEDDMGIFYFDEDAKKWRQVQTTRGSSGTRTLTAATEHFTDFIVATIASPDHPVADSFNPTSIKNIKAADPAAGVDLIAPPVPSPDGAAHLAFPIWVPPGRQGMQPQLAATYNSEAGNGILGIGWDLPISSIQVDTRFGVPEYKPDEESETYSLDGELLTIDPDPKKNGGRSGRVEFHRRAEGRFDTIIRTGPGPREQADDKSTETGKAYRWEVLDKKGTHFIYGETFGARGSAKGRGVYRWYLERVVDAFGNQILYSYDKQVTTLPSPAGTKDEELPIEVQIYPKTIQYTADSSGKNAHYRAEFELNDHGQPGSLPESFPRKDPFTNARGGTIERIQYRITNIRLIEDGKAAKEHFRRYHFVYKDGAFGKSLLDYIRVARGEDDVDKDVNPEFYRHTFQYTELDKSPVTNHPSFSGGIQWGAAGGAPLSQVDSDFLVQTTMGGWGPGGCPYFHFISGISQTLPDLPFDLPLGIPSKTEDRTLTAFVDLNGDGLPDVINNNSIFLNGGNVLLSNNPTGFVTAPSSMVGVPTVGHAARVMADIQVAGAHLAYEAAHANANHVLSASTDTEVLADMNGDGFIDHVAGDGSGVTVKPNLGAGFGVPDATWTGSKADFNSVGDDITANQKDSLTFADPTIRWKAPYAGLVVISGAAKKKELGPSGTDDGVLILIQSFTTDLNGNISRTSSWSQNLTDTTPCVPGGDETATSGCGIARSIHVAAGDRIYFRSHSHDKIDFDTINWSPSISYAELCDSLPCQTVSTDQRGVVETYNAAAFDFDQTSDFRIAGEPISRWTNASAGHVPRSIQITGSITKGPTSDAVDFKILRYPRPPNGQPPPPPTEIPFPAGVPAMPLSADFNNSAVNPNSPTINLNFPVTVNEGDSVVFQASSSTPIDPAQIVWNPHVDYNDFCRVDTAPSGSKDLSVAVTVCGPIIGCSSAPGGGDCQIQDDPDAANNPISSNLVRQDIPMYFQLPLFTSVGAAAGFTASSDGQLAFAGLYTASSVTDVRLVARSQNRILFDTSAPGTTGPFGAVPLPASNVTVEVKSGESVTFDVFATPGSPSKIVSDGVAWTVSTQFTGTAGPDSRTLNARRNYRPTSLTPPDRQAFHGWSVVEWKGSGSDPTQFDESKLAPITTPDSNSQTPYRLMTARPQGEGLLTMPLWRGSGFDDFIAAGSMKPSRLGKPASISAGALFATKSSGNMLGAGFIYSTSHDSSNAQTVLMLTDINGDRYPDFFNGGQISLNHPGTGGASAGGQFDTNFKVLKSGLGDLRHIENKQISATLGVSAAFATYMTAKNGAASVPGWVSLLPTLGIAYGAVATTAELFDINGDGLPDYVSRSNPSQIMVRYNLGYEFTSPVPWDTGTWDSGGPVAATFTGEGIPVLPSDFTGAAQTAVSDLAGQALRMQDNASNNIGAGYSYFGGNQTAAVTRTVLDMIDINGDGLPDMVLRKAGSNLISIKFNTGSSFAPEVTWDMPAWGSGPGRLEQDHTVGMGLNDALTFSESHGRSGVVGFSQGWETGIYGCFQAEGATSGTKNHTGSQMVFEDIDGDGAPDQVLKMADSDKIFVRQNPATGASGVNLLQSVLNPLGGRINLTYERMGHVIDATSQVDMPRAQNVLQSVRFFDGMPDSSFVDTDIDYRLKPAAGMTRGAPSGRYDRGEREFMGFSHLTITHPDGSRIERTYDTSAYHRRHLLLNEVIRDTTAKKEQIFRQTANTYQDRSVVAGTNPSLFPALVSEVTSFYENMNNDLSAPDKTTAITRDYDARGNQTCYADSGDVGIADDIQYSIAYQDITDSATSATFPRAKSVTVNDATAPSCIQPKISGGVLRQRTAVYGTHGEMLNLSDTLFGGKDPATGTVYVASGPKPTWTFTYYDNGNLNTSKDPNGYLLTYTYDPTAQTHIASILDSFNYTSSRTYQMEFGQLQDTFDVNGRQERILYDTFGRMSQVFGPSDVENGVQASTPTIAMDYSDLSQNRGLKVVPHWARTKHKDESPPPQAPDTRKASLDNIVFADGMDRVRQIKKDGIVNDVTGSIVSGQVKFDIRGRVLQQGFPTFEPAPDPGQPEPTPSYNPFPLGRPATSYSYDVLSRTRAVRTPDDKGPDVDPGLDHRNVVTTLIDYNAKILNGVKRLTKSVQDPQGKLRTEYLSPRQEILAVSEVNRLGAQNVPGGTATVLTTRYVHDPLSQLTTVTDAAGHVTSAVYDSVGHMVTLISPDAGQTEWRYDVAGKLGAKETAQLRAQKKLIKYGYEVNRLITIDNPDSADVTYTYGPPTATAKNQAGRITQVSDESGTEIREYDILGNVSLTERTPAVQSPMIPPVTYEMKYSYDYLGRTLAMTFPDGEVVSYGYGTGGLVKHVEGDRPGFPVNVYVKNVLYDEFERRLRLEMGDSTITDYAFAPDTQRLKALLTSSSSATTQDLEYEYDLVGNVTTLSNKAPVPTTAPPKGTILPGRTDQTFGYDDLYQLTSATGTYKGCAFGCGNDRRYTLTMQYDGLGNLTRKTQSDVIVPKVGNPIPQTATSYNVAYGYTSARPHAPTSIGGETLGYDADGNQTSATGSFGVGRTMTWEENDRLRSEIDSGFTATFLYDADGNRTHKRRTTLETWYVSPSYVVKNSLTETKHIMLGSDRIVSAVANISRRTDPTTAGASILFYYHPDHLQSTNYVTATDGSVLQHDEYFPSGEVWFGEQKNNDPRNTQPYLFNGKELDETGLYYYGARYYNPKFSLWTSPDPVLASYMQGEGNNGVFTPRNLGLYSYSWNNPIVLRDPDGKIVWLAVAAGVAWGILKSSGTPTVPATGGEAGIRPTSNLQLAMHTAAGTRLALKAIDIGHDLMSSVETSPVSANNSTSTMTSAQNMSIDPSTLVCRGGECTAAKFAGGTGVTTEEDGTLSGVSVQARPGINDRNDSQGIQTLARPFKHGKVGFSTIADIQKAGGEVVLDGTSRNPNHATMSGLTPEKLEQLFTPAIDNPAPKSIRGTFPNMTPNH